MIYSLRTLPVKSRGYILLEVLLSLTILSTGLLAIIRSISTSLEATSVTRSETHLILATQRILVEAESAVELSEGVTSDILNQDNRTFYWKRIVSKDKDVANLFNVKVTVTMDANNRKRNFFLETKLYNIEESQKL
ncbi:MAG: hypothetical protein KAR31_10675 [Candidatus Omnitrophica bacterium]|nr:hypothetical protein [Candidatus Omnitrophota bacterium]